MRRVNRGGLSPARDRMPTARRDALRTGVLLAVAAATLLVACRNEAAPATLGLHDLNGREVDPLQSRDVKATVFFFARTDCPISNRYAPEIQRIVRKFSAGDVSFWLVYPDPRESAEVVRAHMKAYGFDFGVLRDPKHAFVAATGAKVTPEAAVFLPDRRMVYRGRIDDLFVDFGKSRPAPTRHDLEDVLDAVLSGKPVTLSTTTAVGCFIPELR